VDRNVQFERLQEFAATVVRRLREAGHRAFFAGGCVRDLLLGVRPKDFDVATSAAPEAVRGLFRRTVAIGAAFGVVRVLSTGRPPAQVEVATFRRESGYSDGRHPDRVEFADEVEDVRRRDFTINGLLYDPLERKVLDYVDGQADLERRVIRAIGDPRERFAEDRLRMLRAVRFSSTLDFAVEPATLAAVRAQAEAIGCVSAERIRDELEKMLTGPRPRQAVELLRSAGLLRRILPEVEALAGTAQPEEFHPEGDAWVHTLLMLGFLSHPSLTLALGALLHDIGKPRTFVRSADRIRFHEHEKVGAELACRVMLRLRFPKTVVEQVGELVRQHMVFKDVKRMRLATLKRFLRQPHFEEHLELHRLDCLASHGKLTAHAFCRARLAEFSRQELRPARLLTGEDLKALGLPPGPRFGEILREVEELQLEGRLPTRAAAMAYLKRKIAEPDAG
jgi:poly(A) polymerase